VKVGDLMTREVHACKIDDSLNGAARIMWDHDCGCVPVVDGQGRLAGIVTDRDICMAAYTQGQRLEEIPLERAMSARVVSCARGDDLETAYRLMRTHEIHRLPVVDSRGRPAGILSLSDLVNHWRGDRAAAAAVEIATTLSAILRRRERAVASASVSSNGGTVPPRKSSEPSKGKRVRARKPSTDLR
jgi:CBS domain-containing protein